MVELLENSTEEVYSALGIPFSKLEVITLVSDLITHPMSSPSVVQGLEIPLIGALELVTYGIPLIPLLLENVSQHNVSL